MRVILSRFLACAAILGVTGPAFAADMPVKAPPPPPPTAWSWTGFYVGVDGGYGWNRSAGNSLCINPAGILFAADCTSPTGPVMRPSGGLFGGEAGYNYQSGVVVTGIETDLQWSGIKGSGTTPLNEPIFVGPVASYSATGSMDWFGTTRVRIGILPEEHLLVYATGGAFYGDESVTATGIALPGHVPAIFPASASTTRVGGTVGAGLEYAFNGNLSAKVEGLYYDMGTLTAAFTCPAGATTCTPSGSTQGGTFPMRGTIWRAGLNWHFNSGPIYAKE
jgi:outer membrane immunogenic protein